MKLSRWIQNVTLVTCLLVPALAKAVDSPEIHDDATVTFRVIAPRAEKVMLLGDWRKRGVDLPMAKGDDGVWTATAGPFEPGNHIYGFDIDGVAVPDPENSSVKIRATKSGSFFHIPGDAVWEAKDVPHGNVDLNFHQSSTLGDTRWFSVYTPPGYHANPDKKYPVLYLLHGNNDTAIGWVMIGSANFILDNLIAEGKAQEMIVVMPFGHAVPQNAPRNIQSTNTPKFEEYLLTDVIPLVESKYRVEASQQDRAIAGLSMGGGQAVTIGLKNLDKFSVIGAFSGAVPRTGSGAVAEALKDAANVNEQLSLFWFGCGRDDFLIERNESFSAQLKELGIEHELNVTEGVHNYKAWREYLAMLVPQLFAK